MPPKARHTREDIIDAGLDIARTKGIDAVTAMEISKKLGTSVSPIFTHFNTLDELRCAVRDKSWDIFSSYLKIADDYAPSFKMRGMQLVRFSKDEPELFKLLLMAKTDDTSFSALMGERVRDFESDIETIEKDYGVSKDDAQHIFDKMWVFTYGMCVMISCGIASFTDEETVTLLGEQFAGMLMMTKSGSKDAVKLVPVPKNEWTKKSMFPDV